MAPLGIATKAASAVCSAGNVARATRSAATARARKVARAFRRKLAGVSLRTAASRACRRSLPVMVTLGAATGARYWRSYQRLEDGDLVWPDESCVASFDEALELAERSGLFPDGQFDVDAVRQWHRERGYFGGVVVRNLEDSVIDDLCYYVYYELRGCGQLEQHIFIRGTSTRDDIAVDLEVTKAFDHELGCYFHAGFLRRAECVLADVSPLLQKGATLTIAGHSMGGAVATCIGLKLQRRGYRVGKVVTFGAPKLTNAEALDAFRELPLLRVCHEDDIVVGLPPASVYELITASWKGVYHHVGHQLLLASAPHEACFLGSETALQWWHHSCFFLLSPEMLGAHRLTTYINRLQELRDGKAKILPYNVCTPRGEAS